MSPLVFFVCLAGFIAATKAQGLAGCRMDLLFILDDSRDVKTQTDWTTKIDAWAVLLQQVNIYIGKIKNASLDVNVGVMTFSTTASVKLQLQAPNFQLSSSNCPYSGGSGRDAAAAFRLMTTSVFNGQGGDRAGVPNVAVYIPVSVSKSPGNSTWIEAEKARAAGISITSIAIANDAKNNDMSVYINEVSNVTGGSGRYWKVYAYPHIEIILDRAVQGACNAARNIIPPEDKHGPGCLADLCFLLDSSGSMRDNNPPNDDNWRIMTEFVVNVISYFDVGQAYWQDRVAAIKFNNDANVQYYLNNATNNQQAYDGVRGIRIGYGLTNIADAFKLTYSDVFNTNNGDRPDRKNVAIIITDGKSTVNIGRAIPEAQEAKKRNILVISVGITTDVDQQELCNISTTPDFCFWRPNFADLSKTLVNLLTSYTCFGVPTTIAPPPTSKPTAIHPESVKTPVVTIPTGTPNPNSVPTGNPNSVPTGNPNSVPTGNPNSVPTGNPNSVPTGNPNSVPTGNPNSVPTGNPNSVPTGNPNSVPTGNPNSVPTGNPNTVSTGNPNPTPNPTPRTTTPAVTLPPPSECGLIDITFILDASGSIRAERFPVVRQMIADIVARLDVSTDHVHVGLVSYSDNAVVEAKLNAYMTRETLIAAIMKIAFVGGRTNIAGALRITRTDIFTGSNGDRPDVENIAVIVTDGMDNIDEEQTVPEAIRLKQAGVFVMDIAVGTQIDLFVLQAIASTPAAKAIYRARTMNDLAALGLSIFDTACNNNNPCSSNPCMNGATCTANRGGYWCQCPAGKSGDNCDYDCSGMVDINFLVDISGSVDTAYNAAVQFVLEVVEYLNIYEGGTHVAVTSYQNNSNVQFYLNTYTTSRQVQLAITYYYRPIGVRSTNTPSALHLTYTDIFTSGKGDRAGVKNVAVVVTDGRTTVNPAQTIPEADSTKAAGIEIYSVGLLNGPGMDELNGMASDDKSTHIILVKSDSDEDIAAASKPLIAALCSSK